MRKPIISIIGRSGSGKTTLLEKLIPELVQRGYRVAVIKHHPESGLELDTRGKDTWRLSRAGANQVLLATPDQILQRTRLEHELSLNEIADRIPDVDLVLTEGYKHESTHKIEVIRGQPPSTFLARPEELVAVASDIALDAPAPLFDLDDMAGLADLIESRFLSGSTAS